VKAPAGQHSHTPSNIRPDDTAAVPTLRLHYGQHFLHHSRRISLASQRAHNQEVTSWSSRRERGHLYAAAHEHLGHWAAQVHVKLVHDSQKSTVLATKPPARTYAIPDISLAMLSWPKWLNRRCHLQQLQEPEEAWHLRPQNRGHQPPPNSEMVHRRHDSASDVQADVAYMPTVPQAVATRALSRCDSPALNTKLAPLLVVLVNRLAEAPGTYRTSWSRSRHPESSSTVYVSGTCQPR